VAEAVDVSPSSSAIDAQEPCLHQLIQVLSILAEFECRVDPIRQRYLIKAQLQHDLCRSEVVFHRYIHQHAIAQLECLCCLFTLFIESYFPNCLRAGQRAWVFFKKEMRGAINTVLSINGALLRQDGIDQAVTVNYLVNQVNCKYELVTSAHLLYDPSSLNANTSTKALVKSLFERITS